MSGKLFTGQVELSRAAVHPHEAVRKQELDTAQLVDQYDEFDVDDGAITLEQDFFSRLFVVVVNMNGGAGATGDVTLKLLTTSGGNLVAGAGYVLYVVVPNSDDPRELLVRDDAADIHLINIANNSTVLFFHNGTRWAPMLLA